MTPEDRYRVMDALSVISEIVSRLSNEGCSHDETYFERIMCPEPCGSMHTYCSACGVALEPPCPLPERYPLGSPWVD